MATNLVCWNCGGPRAENGACTVCPAPPERPRVDGPRKALPTEIKFGTFDSGVFVRPGMTLEIATNEMVRRYGFFLVLRSLRDWIRDRGKRSPAQAGVVYSDDAGAVPNEIIRLFLELVDRWPGAFEDGATWVHIK